MQSKKEIEFNKYKERGSLHWREMTSRDIRVFNAYQQARYEWILKLSGGVRGKKVLDLGCGDGSFTYMLAKAGADVTGVDNEELGLKYAGENLESMNKKKNLKYTFVPASAYELPFEANSFDVVVNCEVIEHLQEPMRMLREVKRVLRPGGKFVLTTPHRITEVPQDKNHVTEYFPTEIQSMMEEVFTNVGVKQTHHMLWRSLYTYGFRSVGSRALGRWFLNILTLWFGWNLFMVDYDKPGKFDTFATICSWGSKESHK